MQGFDMGTDRTERKLTTILAADVVGYSRLMAADEAGTLAQLKAHRNELIDPKAAQYHGRTIKLMGDGTLMEFASVVDAVAFAVDMQGAMRERNAGVPEDRQIRYRVGINIGDIIIEGDDIYGDGVNVAARLETVAPPGGICASRQVVEQIAGKLDVAFGNAGRRRLKNIAKPVEIWFWPRERASTMRRLARRWRPIVAALALMAVAAGAFFYLPVELAREQALPLPDKPSIAVLPFANMSDDPQQEFFADGITDDLITDLSRLSGLFVIARNSTFAYKGKEVDVREVARELGVRYVLEGSVRLSGDRVRINAQLIDTVTGGHQWAERYDGSLADVFSMQDRVTNAIVDALALRLTDTDRIALGQQETNVPAAYDAFLRGWEHYRRTTPEDFAQAIPYFEAAIELDPEYGRAYAAAAMAYARISVWRWHYILGISRSEARARARQFLLKAERHKTALAYQAAGLLLESHWLHDPALVEFEEAILLEPGDSWSYAFMAFTLTSAGRPAEAISHIRTAIRLDPHSPSFFMYVLGLTEFSLENFEAAAAAAESSTRLNPDDDGSFLLLASIYGHLGRQQDARAAIARYNEIIVARGGVALTISSLSPCSACPSLYLSKPADSGRLYEGLRLAGVSEAVIAGTFSAKNLLTASEVQALFFGHRLHGRTFESGEEHAATITTDGVATLTGDWASTGGGTMAGSAVRFEGDEVCFLWSDTVKQCGSVLRNPGGLRAKENEFIWYHGDGAFTFSQVE